MFVNNGALDSFSTAIFPIYVYTNEALGESLTNYMAFLRLKLAARAVDISDAFLLAIATNGL